MGEMPQPGDVYGRYLIVKRLGSGGMGTVFKAVQQDLGRAVALKVLLPQYSGDPEFRKRFAREARGLAALDSPHVIQVYEYGEHDGQLYMATQLVRGVDLDRRIADRGPLPLPVALDVVAQIARGLADVHDAGLLHRDVKPSNVLLREQGGDVHAYLCDFGIARSEHDDHTSTGVLTGTFGYMAPERHDGKLATVASDVYSLGCVLWMTVSGAAPFAPATGVRLAMAHLSEPVPTLVSTDPLADRVNGVLARAMAKDPHDRFRSASEMRAALRGAVAFGPDTTGAGQEGPAPTEVRPIKVAGLATPPPVPPPVQPVASAPPQAPSPTWRPARRRGIAIAVAALALALGAGGVGYALTADDAEPRAKTAAGGKKAATAASTPASSPTKAKPARAPRRKPKPTAPAPAPSPTIAPQTAPPTAAPPATSVPTLTCWDGQQATTREGCSRPAGFDGMLTVFPSMESCSSAPTRRAGKAEAYECFYDGFVIRYSRWQEGYDRYAYFDAENQVTGSQWFVNGQFAGRQWFSEEYAANERETHQWTASYRFHPYSVSVEGTSAEARRAGIGLVRAASPDRIGLR